MKYAEIFVLYFSQWMVLYYLGIIVDFLASEDKKFVIGNRLYDSAQKITIIIICSLFLDNFPI